MYKQQLPDEITDGFVQFMDDFGIEWPTEEASLPFLREGWWGFSLDKKNPAHRTKAVKAAYDLLCQARDGFSGDYWAWLSKYKSAAHEWAVIKQADALIPTYLAQLNKPVTEYARGRNGIIQNENARFASYWLEKKASAEKYFERCMAVADTPPVPDYGEIERAWEMLRYHIEAYKPKPPKKEVVAEVRVVEGATRRGESVLFTVEDAVKAMSKLSGNVAPFGAAQVSAGDFGQWLRVLGKGFISLTRTAKGIKLEYKENESGKGLGVVAEFLETKDEDICHILITPEDICATTV